MPWVKRAKCAAREPSPPSFKISKASLLSFVIDGAHAHDIGTIMDVEGVAIRAGHHCAMPAMRHFGVAATARASFAMYNTVEEVDALVAGIHKVREVFRL